MKAKEIFELSVKVMKQVVPPAAMADSMRRARERGEEGNISILSRQRHNVNELVRKVLDCGGPCAETKDAPVDLIDAVVLRYLRNRELFMKTFPEGIDDADPDPFSIWASIMISPGDVQDN